MEIINYKGFDIKISHQLYAENPFEEWDDCMPLISKSDGYVQDYSKGDINDYLSDILSDGQIIRHQKELAEVLEMNLEDYETKEDKIDDIRSEIGSTEDFDALAVVCKLSNTPYKNTSSRGCSQGDHAYIFTCYTKRFETITGCTLQQIKENDSLKNAVDLFGYWAWGETYKFYIPEIEDSCGGFYGSDHKESGLLEMAIDSIDGHLESVKRKKQKKVKQLIKNRVPHIYRKSIIEKVLEF